MPAHGASGRLAATRFAGFRWVAETGSTNADLAAEVRAGRPGPAALVADHQTAGRGRLDRRWEAPPGASLLLSVALPEPHPAGGPALLSTALAVSAVDAVQQVAGAEVALKWPNDVVAPTPDERDPKVGGVLAELVEGPAGPAVVVGIGLNVRWPDGMPGELAATATSLDALVGHDVDREDLAVALLAELDGWLSALQDGGAEQRLRHSYRDRCRTLGRRVRVVLPQAEVVGTAVDLAPGGELVVEDEQRVRRTFSVGDVVHLRA